MRYFDEPKSGTEAQHTGAFWKLARPQADRKLGLLRRRLHRRSHPLLILLFIGTLKKNKKTIPRED